MTTYTLVALVLLPVFGAGGTPQERSALVPLERGLSTLQACEALYNQPTPRLLQEATIQAMRALDETMLALREDTTLSVGFRCDPDYRAPKNPWIVPVGRAA